MASFFSSHRGYHSANLDDDTENEILMNNVNSRIITIGHNSTNNITTNNSNNNIKPEEQYSNLVVIVNPDKTLSIAATAEDEHLIIGNANTNQSNNEGEESHHPLMFQNPSRMYMRLARYYSNPMRTRRRKFLFLLRNPYISLLLSDILYCLLLLSATREFTLFTTLLITIVLVDLLGIIGASKDNLSILTSFIVISSLSVIAQSIMAFSPLFILRILVVLMAFRVRGELTLQAVCFLIHSLFSPFSFLSFFAWSRYRYPRIFFLSFSLFFFF